MPHRISLYDETGKEYMRYVVKNVPKMSSAHDIRVCDGDLRFGDKEILVFIEVGLTDTEVEPFISDLADADAGADDE